MKTPRPGDDVVRKQRPMAGLVPLSLRFPCDDRDDATFVEQVGAIVRGVVREVDPAEIYVVKIDSWFGQRWLGFSHKLLGMARVSSVRALRVPPFIPTRVVSQYSYLRADDGRLVAFHSARRLDVYQPSEDNNRRLVSKLYPAAALFWWSGATAQNGRGSLMAYLPAADGHIPWYAEIARRADGTWIISRTSGISPDDLRRHVDRAREMT